MKVNTITLIASIKEGSKFSLRYKAYELLHMAVFFGRTRVMKYCMVNTEGVSIFFYHLHHFSSLLLL